MLSDDELKRYRELLNAQNDSTYFKKEIGANLKNARANTPLTQEDVAEIFDCDPRKIRRYASRDYFLCKQFSWNGHRNAEINDECF